MAVGFATGFGQVVQVNAVDGDHENVPLPVPFNVVLDPAHIEIFGPALAVGNGFTVTVTVCVLVQPLAFVPVTVYVVLTVGFTVIIAPVDPPYDQLYVVPPDAVSVLVCPLHIVVGLTVMVGFGLTVIDTVWVLVQPEALVPVTVYEVVTVGHTVMTAPVDPP